MNSEQFVEILNKNVRESVLKIVVSDLENTDSSYSKLVALSTWYNSKDDIEKKNILNLITRVYDCAAFRFLCMLDSVAYRTEPGSYYELYHVCKDGKELLINPENSDELHDLYVADFKK
ncbi:MAG: hypothetical protein J6A41_00695 [Ruminiclostridium sp.]|nr:hypothetical protein [Ruminiclostridium sp.]